MKTINGKPSVYLTPSILPTQPPTYEARIAETTAIAKTAPTAKPPSSTGEQPTPPAPKRKQHTTKSGLNAPLASQSTPHGPKKPTAKPKNTN